MTHSDDLFAEARDPRDRFLVNAVDRWIEGANYKRTDDADFLEDEPLDAFAKTVDVYFDVRILGHGDRGLMMEDGRLNFGSVFLSF